MNVENERFKLMKHSLPPVENGVFSVEVTQEVTTPEVASFQAQMDFHVNGAHFNLAAEEIQALYPEVNASGNYADCIGHITLKKKTYPWENSILPQKLAFHDNLSDPEVVPWLALICISMDENVSTKEIMIKELFDNPNHTSNIFYPLKSMPSCTEKPEDICRIIDLPLSLYDQVMPRENEIELLTHVKVVDLYDKCDDMVAMDGYFSVVVSNRFLPSGDDSLIKSTLHLVSIEGFDGYLPEGSKHQELERYTSVRLVSLYSWDVFSMRKGEADFRNIIKNIDSGPLAISAHDVLKRGHIPLRHMTRSGEETVSLYRGPLIPYLPIKEEDSRKYTADGRMIYDPEHGIMDLSYSSAWQLGRLLILKDKSIAAALLRWKKENTRLVHLEADEAVFNEMQSLALKLEQGDIIDFWAQTLSGEITNNKLVGPVAKDPKKKTEAQV